MEVIGYCNRSKWLIEIQKYRYNQLKFQYYIK